MKSGSVGAAVEKHDEAVVDPTGLAFVDLSKYERSESSASDGEDGGPAGRVRKEAQRAARAASNGKDAATSSFVTLPATRMFLEGRGDALISEKFRKNQTQPLAKETAPLDKSAPRAAQYDVDSPDPDEALMKRSIFNQPSRQKQEASNTAAKKQKARWFDIPVATLTPELEKDIQLIRNRQHLDPQRFYKSMGDSKWNPKNFYVGTVIEGPGEFRTGRIVNRERKQHLVDELLSDSQFQTFAKRKVAEVQQSKAATYRRRSGMKAFKKSRSGRLGARK
ncbi:rRNA-processing protein fcf2 [Porphyridium purpureum]|uniref:rRNA-processing protein fcf2 n=1 Tax=Porphyridium purpureum TaxID=35688 RepID=A0A5J4Z362_PORPP|nr:rRNA-processing protein fcf2 [Porphyridium purpureum]|eukprot:POR5277..scf295_1